MTRGAWVWHRFQAGSQENTTCALSFVQLARCTQNQKSLMVNEVQNHTHTGNSLMLSWNWDMRDDRKIQKAWCGSGMQSGTRARDRARDKTIGVDSWGTLRGSLCRSRNSCSLVTTLLFKIEASKAMRTARRYNCRAKLSRTYNSRG